ncbi:hypothetical protein [Actinoplanes auranticolor]|nr:hypothetical protein [Actinoplanes auranticolor]
MRGATTLGSLFTGLAVGTICGVIAWAAARLINRQAGTRKSDAH